MSTGRSWGSTTPQGRSPPRRAAAGNRGNVSYVHGDPTRDGFDAAFDAVVGRYVLMFQPDPAGFLGAVARHARPGGIVCFHELDARGVASRPPVPTFDQLASWNAAVTRRYGADPNFGSALYAAFVTAGLTEPSLLADAIHGRGADAGDVLVQIRNLARSLMTERERFGVATREQVGIDTVLDRMTAEATATDSMVVGHLQVAVYCTVWATVPRPRFSACGTVLTLSDTAPGPPSGRAACAVRRNVGQSAAVSSRQR